MWTVRLLLFAQILSLHAKDISLEYIPATRTPPSRRIFPVMGYSPTSDFLLTYSGNPTINDQNALWAFSFTNHTWTSYISHDSITPSNK